MNYNSYFVIFTRKSKKYAKVSVSNKMFAQCLSQTVRAEELKC